MDWEPTRTIDPPPAFFMWGVAARATLGPNDALARASSSSSPTPLSFARPAAAAAPFAARAEPRLGQVDSQAVFEALLDAVTEAERAHLLQLRDGAQVMPDVIFQKFAELAASGDKNRFDFPRPMTNKPGLNFSFSGLKTFAMNTVNSFKRPQAQDRADIAAAFQEAVVDTIRIKCERALTATGLNTLVMAGGVSANLELRARLEQMAAKKGYRIYYPPHHLCTDNGAMIAYAGYLRQKAGGAEGLAIDVRPRWPMTELNA